jgi:glycosyltransferase involved in cell wall biosynthesis
MRLLVLTHNYPRFPGDFSGSFIQALCEALAAADTQPSPSADFAEGIVARAAVRDAGVVLPAGEAVTVLTPFDPAFVRPGSESAEDTSPVEVLTYRYIFPDFLHRLGYMRTLESDIQLRGWALLLAPFMFVFGALAALRVAGRIKPDLIHAHWVLPNGFIGALVARQLRIPLVVSLPGSDVLMAGKNPLFRWMANYAWQSASLITTNSAELRDEAIRLGAPAGKFELIIYGVNAAQFVPSDEGTAELRAALGLSIDDVVVLGVGRMVYKKGFDVLIRAIALLHELHGHVKAVLIGEGDLKSDWQKLAVDSGVGERVLFVGRVPYDQIARYYNMADMLAMPSVTHPIDGLNVCVLDAMACAKPIVASRVAGNPLVVADGINGIRVDEGRPEQLAHAIARLADAPALRVKMGAASRKRVEEEFDWPHLAAHYLREFEDIISPPHLH